MAQTPFTLVCLLNWHTVSIAGCLAPPGNLQPVLWEKPMTTEPDWAVCVGVSVCRNGILSILYSEMFLAGMGQLLMLLGKQAF